MADRGTAFLERRLGDWARARLHPYVAEFIMFVLKQGWAAMFGILFLVAIIGTKAVNTPHLIADLCVEFPAHIIVGLDTKDGKLAVDGWSKLSHHDVHDLARQFETDGVEALVHTDIGRDGMLSGVNIESTVELAKSVHIPVIASGGIRSLDDIRELAKVADEGIVGAITGRAIYEGTLDFSEGQKLADSLAS